MKAPQLQLILTLTTVDGRTGLQDLLAKDSSMFFAIEDPVDDSDGHTIEAKFVLKRDGIETDEFSIDGDAWRELEDGGHVGDFVQDVKEGSKIEPALRAQLDQFENQYEHAKCDTTWSDTHSCGCDDECPKCGAPVSPTLSVHLAGLTDDVPARYFSRFA